MIHEIRIAYLADEASVARTVRRVCLVRRLKGVIGDSSLAYSFDAPNRREAVRRVGMLRLQRLILRMILLRSA